VEARFTGLRHLGVVFSRFRRSESDVNRFFEGGDLGRLEFACRGEVGCDMTEGKLERLYGKALPVGVGVEGSMAKVGAAIQFTG
jgi:hypothetical protein